MGDAGSGTDSESCSSLRWTPAVLGSLAAGTAAVAGIFCFQGLKKLSHRPPALSDRAALLVENIASRSILLSIGSRNDGIFHRAGTELFLPRTGRCAFFLALSIALSRIVLGMHFLSDVARRDGPRRDAWMRLITAFSSLGSYSRARFIHCVVCLPMEVATTAEIFASQKIIQHTQRIWKSRNVSEPCIVGQCQRQL